MAIDKFKASDLAASRSNAVRAPKSGQLGGLLWVLIVALLVSGAWKLTYLAKQRRAESPVPLLNLVGIQNAQQIEPALTVFTSPDERANVAKKVFEAISERGGSISNTTILYRLKVFTPAQFAQFKPRVSVRSWGDFDRDFRLWGGAILAAFLLTSIVWNLRGFRGPWIFLPLLLLATGIGFSLMLALRDPLRDTPLFVPFAQGVVGGCTLMLLSSFIEWETKWSNLSFVPLLGALILSIALIAFGSGPGRSDAKVNLGPAQPVEVIKILLVFFLAGFFGKKWPLLRQLRHEGVRRFDLPKLEHAVPVLTGVAVAVLFFFLQKDLGPALVFASVFLALYALARNRVGLAVAGASVLATAFLAGHFLDTPHPVHERVAMFLSPWDNAVHGGDQVVHSLWAISSGGPLGTGPGLGETDVIPAGYTDLIISVLGEEWGFAGVAIFYAIFALLVWTGLRIARRARTDYAVFLALGLTILLSAELLLISLGILGLFPLSGVATPFLSYGKTAMFANFAIVGILASLGSNPGSSERTAPFHSGIAWIGGVLAAVALAVVGKAAYVQVLHPDDFAGKGALVTQADNVRRYVYNPRLTATIRDLKRGTVYDRDGLPLATSRWEELEQNRARYKDLGIDIDSACNPADQRHYPLGGATFHLLGDVRTRANWGAPNSSLIERDAARRLQGFDDHGTIETLTDAAGKEFKAVHYDYRELLPLLRHRWEPDDPAVKRVRDRDRDVHMSIHAGLQLKALEILKARLAEQKLRSGSVVVMDPGTGDLLASVNWPAPEPTEEKLAAGEATGALLDRASYGLYPPGSTFKIVTAIAALRTDPSLAHQPYQCVRLPDGRNGNFVGNSKRPIRDDVEDATPHGTLDMHRAITVSCNAYFAQLGSYKVGPDRLLETGKLFGIAVAEPATAKNLAPQMAQSSYGQGQVVVSPFQMARVAATVAAGGMMPFGRWVTDASNTRTQAAVQVLPKDQAGILADDMRSVVTSGTAKRLTAIAPAIAGKTGTAELATAPSHAWFIGFAPYNSVPGLKRIAFSILAENGRYGGTAAAPVAGDLVVAAQKLGLIQ